MARILELNTEVLNFVDSKNYISQCMARLIDCVIMYVLKVKICKVWLKNLFKLSCARVKPLS